MAKHMQRWVKTPASRFGHDSLLSGVDRTISVTSGSQQESLLLSNDYARVDGLFKPRSLRYVWLQPRLSLT